MLKNIKIFPEITKHNISDFFSYQNNDHKDFVQDLSWSPVDGCLRTCGWDTQIIRHTTTMIEEGMVTKVNKTVALETSVIARVGCNGIISTVNTPSLVE